MNRKILVSAFFALLLGCATSFAQMTDQAIMNYITAGMAAGKSNTQIGNELLAKGVTASQAKRLMSKYQSSNAMGEYTNITTTTLDPTKGKTERGVVNSKNPYGRNGEGKVSSITKEDPMEKTEVKKIIDGDDKVGEQVEEQEIDADGNVIKKIKKKQIFGHDIFRNKNLTFEPNENSATPSSYVIGPGDEVIIDVWGVNEATISSFVSPEGFINISQIGPITLSGLTIAQAEGKIKTALSKKYSLEGPDAPSKMSVTLGQIRTIQVHVLGEVSVPGTYRLSSMSRVFNALYRAGGVTAIGSLRDVKISRGGRIIGSADIYDFLFDGTSESNISLNDGDAIIVPAYSALIEVSGGVKRPMYYEVKEGESIEHILKYSGGYTSDAFHEEVSVERRSGTDGQVYTVDKSKFGTFGLRDGDIVTIHTNMQKDLYANRIQIKGSVLRPGVYALGGNIATVRQLVEAAGGLLEDAFFGRAQIIREKQDRSMEIVAVPIGAIVHGLAEDVTLRKNDLLMVANKNEMEKKGELNINGYVLNPGDYEFAENMRIEDLIMLAGGLEPGASNARVDVSRRIIDPDSVESCDTLATVYTFSLADGLIAQEDAGFILKPFDVVSVRKSPTYVEQKHVRVSGEATFPGEYTLQNNNERLTDLFKRAGGSTSNGYIQGAMLKRKVSEDERNVRRNMANMMKRGGNTRMDSLKLDKLKISETYAIGIELDKALASPGGSYDVVLHDGDELIIPSMTNTVRVQGEVLYPNAVSYIPGKPVKYYIEQSGGFSNEAKRIKVYVIHMNGKVSVGLHSKVKSGCEIVVPERPERQKTTVSEWLGIGTTAASITTMIATVANYMK